MKLSQLILAVAVSACGTAFAADNHGHDIKPMHGGAVAEAKEVEYEFVARSLSDFPTFRPETPSETIGSESPRPRR